MKILEASALTVGYWRKPVVSSMNFGLRLGEVVSLIGPNGSGKSTILKTLLGLQGLLSGDITLKGRPLKSYLPKEKAKVMAGVLSRNPSPWGLRALELVEQGRFSRTKDEGLCLKALEDVGALDLSGRFLNELSDGELQRVQIARALSQEPSLLILDEPLSYLDQPGCLDVMERISTLAKNRPMAILLSLHDLDLALSYSDFCLLICHGKLLMGTGEDLFLKGAFGKAYGQKDAWDPFEKKERQSPDPIGSVRLSCFEDYVPFVERALRKKAMAAGDKGPLMTVEGKIPVTFKVEIEGKKSEFDGLDEALVALLEYFKKNK